MESLMKFVIAVQLGVSRLGGRATDRERGATAVEYGLMVALIAAVIITTVGILGGKLNGLFDSVQKALP